MSESAGEAQRLLARARPPEDTGFSWELSPHRDQLPQQLVRRANERHVFHLLRQRGPISRSALVRATGLSAQSVGVIIRRLLEQGLVEETGAERQAGVGRHPIGVRIRSDGAVAFGCVIERDQIDGAWIDLSGTPIAKATVSFPQGEEPERTIQRVEELFVGLSEAAGLPDYANRLPAIGLGLPGPINPDNQRLVNPPNFPHWEGVDPRTLFSASWTLPIFCENSATAAALGEAWQLRAEFDNFLYCHWGVGIGGGLVINLETYRGATGNALELGHVPVVPDGAPCGCGGRGCLEAEASVTAICRQASELGLGDDFDHLAAAAPREPRVAELLTRAGKLLGSALVGAVNLFDVDAVVLGGHHFQDVTEWLLPPVEAAVPQLAIRRGVRPVTVRYSTLGEAAGAVGAASVVFDKLLPYSPPFVPSFSRASASDRHAAHA
ncbi:MAG TPA: ROK family transcriptional regulator [Acidimicrobiales bacterium]|nr:ROK family transcriptional regulator [Acidimicrobiales bacterium]